MPDARACFIEWWRDDDKVRIWIGHYRVSGIDPPYEYYVLTNITETDFEETPPEALLLRAML